MIYNLFNASLWSKSNWRSFTTWPPAADEKPYQVGLGLTGMCFGRVASLHAKNQGGESIESEEERRNVLGSWLQASGAHFNGCLCSEQCSDGVLGFWRTVLGGIISVAGHDESKDSDWRQFATEALVWLQPFVSWIKTGRAEL